MTPRKAQRKRSAPPVPPVPNESDALSALESWYLECLRIYASYLGRAPSLSELSAWMGRTTTPVHRMFSRLETRGYVARDGDRRFVRAVR